MKVYTVAKGATGFDGIKRGERDKPTPGAHQALVRMRAASLNFRDLAIVAGKYIRGPLAKDTIPRRSHKAGLRKHSARRSTACSPSSRRSTRTGC
jgi:hypothetical protein